MKKVLYLIIPLFFTLSSFSQAVSPEWCDTQIPSSFKKWRNNFATTHNLVSTLKHDVCVNKKFSVVFYVIAEQNGTWGNVGPADLDSCIARLNRLFGRICITFMNCSTVVIPNHVFNNWERPDTEDLVTGNWYTENTINVYLPDSINGSIAGYAKMPGGDDVIVIEKSLVATLSMAHEIGHFFGLVHTHAEIGSPVTPAPPPGVSSYEFVNRSNCSQNGDGLCDTEADSYPLGTGTQDGNNEYYVIPKDNIMSYHPSPCRFTQQQYNFMANVILTQRLYLH